MNIESLSAAAGIVLTLCASYLPGFSDWYEPLAPNAKRLLMLTLLLATSLISYGIACAGLGVELGITIECNQQGALTVLRAFISALIANQSAYAISPRSQ